MTNRPHGLLYAQYLYKGRIGKIGPYVISSLHQLYYFHVWTFNQLEPRSLQIRRLKQLIVSDREISITSLRSTRVWHPDF